VHSTDSLLLYRCVECVNAGYELYDVVNEYDRRCRERPEKSLEHVAAHMSVLRQLVRPGHHEERAVHHDHRVERPGVRRVERVAGEHLPGNEEREGYDEPGKRPAHEGAYFVDEEQRSLHKKKPPGLRRMAPGLGNADQAFFAAGFAPLPK